MPPVEHKPLSTGAWSLDELVATASIVVPPGSDTDVPEELRFRSGVARLVQAQRIQGTEDSGLAVFLLARRPDATSRAWETIPMLDNGLTKVGGKVWIVNPPVASGISTASDTLTDDQVFVLVVSELMLGHMPAIVVDFRVATPTMRYYVEGLSFPDIYEPVSLVSVPIPLDRILSEVDLAYQAHLITPEAQTGEGKLWKKSSHWWPAANAEKIVQLYLKIHLTRAFPLCKIREEQTQVTGRIDLEVEEPIVGFPGGFLRHAILELKVLRSRGASGATYTEQEALEWIQKGVEQASAYRDERGALASALCCFDLRIQDTGEVCFTHVRTLATSLRVSLRRWFVYASSEALRGVRAAQPL